MPADRVPVRLDVDRLHRLAGDRSDESAVALCATLGPLGRWVVRASVRRRAVELNPGLAAVASPGRPPLPRTVGTCWAVFTLRADPRRPLPALRPTLVLPFQWRPGPSSGLLPARLTALAATAAAAVGVRGWGLHLHPDVGGDRLDLSGLDPITRPESAWAALAGGLLAAAEGGTPDPAAWATGAWELESGVVPVGRLRAKLRRAAGGGATVMYVPQQQAAAAARLAPPGLTVEPLFAGKSNPRAALAGYTDRLDVPPPPPESADDEAGFQRCIRFHKRQAHGSDRAVDYYWRCLLPTITARGRGRLGRRLGPEAAFAPTHLVTIFSGSPELVLLMAGVLPSVRAVVLLHTDDGQPGAVSPADVADRLASGGQVCRLAPFRNDDTQTAAIPAAVQAFAAEVAADRLVLDLTPGTGRMRWLADRAMPPGSWRVYLGHESKNPGSRPQPGSEDPIPWRA